MVGFEQMLRHWAIGGVVIKRPIAPPPSPSFRHRDEPSDATPQPEAPVSESDAAAVHFQAFFITVEGERYMGDGPHSVSAAELAEVRRMAQTFLQTTQFRPQPASYRIVDSLGRLIEDWRKPP